MSRKKVKLPEGSFKRQMKGYEEIHVPEPPKREVQAGDLVNISQMPEWTYPVWNSTNTTRLNVIQSKVYPIAFGSNEPMLICAPTGAGKVS
jgi:pre-mRNA-splicing helicase BRR2